MIDQISISRQCDDQAMIDQQLKLYFYTINCFIHLKRYDLAKSYINKALSLKSNHFPILNLSKQLNNLLLANETEYRIALIAKEEQLKTLTTNMNALQIDNAQLQQNNAQLLAKIEQLNTQHQQSLSKQKELTEEQVKLKEKIVCLESDLEKSSHTDNQNEISRLQQDLEFQRAEYQKLTEGISDLIQTMDTQEKQINQLEDKLNDKNRLIEEQSNTIKKMKIAADEKSNATSDKQNKNENSSEFGNYRTPVTLHFSESTIIKENKNVVAEQTEKPKISNNNYGNTL